MRPDQSGIWLVDEFAEGSDFSLEYLTRKLNFPLPLNHHRIALSCSLALDAPLRELNEVPAM